MNLTTLRRDLNFWDRFAPWYEKWVSRGSYHRPIIDDLSQMIEPGCRVLDIGAATGVLSIPMASLGCTVEALDPSMGMRDIFNRKLSSLSSVKITILREKWEDYESESNEIYDSVIACNSLHLTDGGMMTGMKRVFSFRARYVCLVTEINQGRYIDFKDINTLQEDYSFLYIRNYSVDSTFHFETMDEVRGLRDILSNEFPVSLEDGFPVQRDRTDVAVLWWERK